MKICLGLGEKSGDMKLRKLNTPYTWASLAWLGATPAFAISAFDYLVEPYLGYRVAGGSTVGPGIYASPAAAYAQYSGFTLGARAGVHFLDLVFLAVDASHSPSLSIKTTATGDNFHLTPTAPVMTFGAANTQVGLVAGVLVPLINIRFWLGYHFLDHLTGTNSATLNGFSLKIGASMPIFVFFSLNAELISSSYSQQTSSGGTSAINLAGPTNNSHLLVSFSSPLTL